MEDKRVKQKHKIKVSKIGNIRLLKNINLNKTIKHDEELHQSSKNFKLR